METFVGPEIPGTSPSPSDGQFKRDGRLKRQATRFRVFEYDSDHPDAEPVEVDLSRGDVAKIQWRVSLANRKAAGDNILRVTPSKRNPGIAEADLVIAPSGKTLDTPGQQEKFDDGAFRGDPVFLGDATVEPSGTLVVAGGLGKSDFVLKPGENGGYSAGGSLSFDNNPFWYDDTSDGPVEATIEFTDGTTTAVKPAWIIVGPADFAPGVGNVVTLYDLMLDVCVRNFSLNTSLFDGGKFRSDYRPSYTNEIYPILHRASQQGWVNKLANLGHVGAHLSRHDDLSLEPDANGDPHQAARTAIFSKLRDPDNPGSSGNMPRLTGDLDGAVYPTQGLTFTRTQFHLMRQWKDGKFVNDWAGAFTPEATVSARGLDIAALESCAGGAFFPGIEVNRIVALRLNIYDVDSSDRADEIRLKPASIDQLRSPGYLTEGNALPWQADFLKCAGSWWPAQRPDEVFEHSGSSQVAWTRGKISNHKDMVQRWHELGIVVQVGEEYHEQERNPDGMFMA
ncbi:MAG TPA: hypothetical protein DDX19_05030 [Rhodopirellula baltica]|nr:hypothetical protein [Rhodopirellula baltica]